MWPQLVFPHRALHKQTHTPKHRYVTGTLNQTGCDDLKQLELIHTMTTVRHDCVVAIECRGYIHTTPTGI